MALLLTDVQIRVLGSLMEKLMTTPEYYPLSLNALVNACNQKSNRDPVVDYDDVDVARALDGLKEKQLAYQNNASRVPKYGANFAQVNNLIRQEAAVMCMLMLRGPQTNGELRGRTERLYKFEGLDQVEKTIADLTELGFVKTLAKQPGRKEPRHAHLLAGEPQDLPAASPKPEPATIKVAAENQRVAALESELADLRQEFDDLKKAFLDFKGQFE